MGKDGFSLKLVWIIEEYILNENIDKLSDGVCLRLGYSGI